MKEFKSSLFIIVKNVFYGIFGGAAIALIMYMFMEDLVIPIIVGTVLGLLIIYFAIVKDNIRIIVDPDRFTVYRGKKLKHSFNTKEVSMHAKIKTVDGDSDCTLTVTTPDGKETRIDCSMLGQSRFYKLLDALDVFDGEPVEVRTKKKQ